MKRFYSRKFIALMFAGLLFYLRPANFPAELLTVVFVAYMGINVYQKIKTGGGSNGL